MKIFINVTLIVGAAAGLWSLFLFGRNLKRGANLHPKTVAGIVICPLGLIWIGRFFLKAIHF